MLTLDPSPTAAWFRHRMLRALAQAQHISSAQAQQAYDAQQQGGNWLESLVQQQAISADALARFLAQHQACPQVDLSDFPVQAQLLDVLPPHLCRRHLAAPLAQLGSQIVVAIADPSDLLARQALEFACAWPLQWRVAAIDQLQQRLQMVEQPHQHLADSLRQSLESMSLATVSPEASPTAETGTALDDAPTVRFLHQLLQEAVRRRASDVHFEPYEHSYRIRFRIDGVLLNMAHPPPQAQYRIASRIKVLARLDIAEKRLPQDGRIQLALTPEQRLDMRVSTLPTLFGEKIVIRLLDAHREHMDWSTQGLDDAQQHLLRHTLQHPHGMILMTGPTGSGKTVTLYSCLHVLNQPDINICTVEDPSEVYLEGVNQVNIQDKAGLDFPTVLRAFLRQDPDVLMVGEVRDALTADIAVKAAQTGHLVLSTLHTSDATSALTRLINMGIPAFHLAAAVTLITAQRLVRRLCPTCKEPHQLPTCTLRAAGFTEAALATPWQLYRAKGCAACTHGYRGRIGIFQLLPISHDLQQLLLQGASVAALRDQAAREGVASLRQDGLRKVQAGITTLDEVLANTTLD
ncbi:MAG: type IV-A pilus assembly ATPase PilB [Comamonas sp.]